MAYELHIERRNGIIQLEDWKSAIDRVNGVRLCSSGHSATNPRTGEVISFPRSEGDAETYSSADNTWRASFYWFNGRISFKAMLLPDNVSDPVWQIAAALASHLDAIIRGDEGEIYDLNTGKVIS